MDMDDPWGSPWADEVQEQTAARPVATKERPKTPDNAPERLKPLSPWADNDDDFGDWEEEPVQEQAEGHRLDFNAADDAWERSQKGEESELSQANSHNTELPWEDTREDSSAAAQKSNPNVLTEGFAAVRQPSPDPWAVRISDDTGIVELHPILKAQHESKELMNAATLDGKYETSFELPPEADQRPLDELHDIETDDCTTKDGIAKEQLIIKSEESPAPGEVVIEEAVGSKEKEKEKEEYKETEKAASLSEIEHESSRPSSSRSDQSNQDEPSPESPRTSLDEPKRPQAPRHVSAKIQELVEHFDGLAKTEEMDVTPVVGHGNNLLLDGQSHEASKPSATDIEIVDGQKSEVEQDDDDFGDFGDFEEGLSDDDDESATVVNPKSRAPIAPTPVQASPSKVSLEKDHGRVHFGVDFSNLSKLFPSPEEEIPEKVFIPDVVPHDSFVSVEERKTWYRLSRYGTMRKHNAGDDENYVRVNWAKSQIRAGTLKTVARWMEEDRISGRVVLGGSSKGSSLFGWNDQNAAPVPIESAFASKHKKRNSISQLPVEGEGAVPREWPKGLVRTPSIPKSRSSSKPRRRSSTRSSKGSVGSKHDLQSTFQMKPPVANFGWSEGSNTESKAAASAPLPSKVFSDAINTSPPRQPPTSTRPPTLSNIIVPPNPHTQNKGPGPGVNGPSILSPILGTPVVIAAPAIISTPIEDDDEWGEMMSTPATPVLPVMPVLPTQHKKQNSVGDFSRPLQPQTPTGFRPPQSPLSLSQTASQSFEDMIVPKSPESTLSTSDSFSLAFDPIVQTSTTPPSSAVANDVVKSPEAVNVHTSNPDPWASADFSFFDSPPKPPPKTTRIQAKSATPPRAPPKDSSPRAPPRYTPGPTPRPAVRNNPTPPLRHNSALPPMATPLRNVAFATSEPFSFSQGNGKSRKEIEEDLIVANIVKGLPDLSYMLR